MGEYQPNASGSYPEVYPLYGIDEEAFTNVDFMGVESPLTTFSTPSSLQFTSDKCPVSLLSPRDGGIYAGTQAYTDSYINDFVPGLNTTSPDYWSAGLAGFTADTIAEPSLAAPSEYDTVPDRSSQSSSAAKSPTGKRKRNPSHYPTPGSMTAESPRNDPINVPTDGGREPPSTHGNDGDGCEVSPITKPSKRQDTQQRHQSNRVAAHKFRTKKNEASQRLKMDKKNKEKVNSELISCVADLTLEIRDLKMQLLQHTDCKCVLIQKYIAHEAKQFVEGIDHTCGREKLDISGP
ncbi:hypothetical protein AK830_g10976 [Neonectria ditissima]|uniref:BZIP domain-containing protein n=1 Tax=Neonectria ditissima TaxID=78410 RepID=A0A0P7B4X6_9HYPO|nr:hypothetical protein AK830_g10976 [Neonectria ditissima]